MGRFMEGRKKDKQVLFLADEETFGQLGDLAEHQGRSKGWILRFLIRNAHWKMEELAETDRRVRMCDLVGEAI